MPGHPNATVAAVAGALTILIVWLVGLTAHIDVPAEVASAVTTLATAVILLLGGRKRTAGR